MVLLLGATTYIGQAFARALRRRKDPFIPLSRKAFDYTRFEFLFDYVRKIRPDLVINAEEHGSSDCWIDAVIGGGSNGVMGGRGSAAVTHLPNAPILQHSIAAAEPERMEMLQANTLLPQTIARVCSLTNTPWGHVSSGSIYSGAKIVENGSVRIEVDLGLPSARSLFVAHPERFLGFTELDEPNFSFKAAPCTFYSGTKALAEEAIRNSQNYIWRLRLPFNEQDEPSNFLSQLKDGLKLYDAINSLSHVDDCVSACLELWERRAPFGTYNVASPGAVSTCDVLHMIRHILKPTRQLQLLVYQENAPSGSEKNLHSDCILDVSKLLKAGVKLRPVCDALAKSLEAWQPHTSPVIKTFA